MKRVILAIAILCLASLACEFEFEDDNDDEAKTTDYYVEIFGGTAAVYDRILRLSDCAELRAEFDQAEENARLHEPGTEQRRSSIGHMTATDDRMEELECDDDPFKGRIP